MHQAPATIINAPAPQPKIPNHVLNHDQFQVAVAAANRQFLLIRKKYPTLKAYLDLSLLGEQTRINSSVKEILSNYPTLIIDDSAKADLLEFLKIPEPKKATPAEKKRLQERFQELAIELKYDAKCQVDMGFIDLNYDLVWQLQADDLVDRNLTPQTKASIRIVLGTIACFSEMDV